MSQAEDPHRLERADEHGVSVEDVRQLMGASTPHFALQLRERIARLIADLPPGHPARVEGEREIARLERLGHIGETRGETGEKDWKLHVLPSVAPQRLLDLSLMLDPRHRSPATSPRCPFDLCDGSGLRVDEQTNTASDCPCRPQLVANARARRLRDRVPRRYTNLSWDRHPLTQLANDPLNADSVRRVRRFCAEIGANLAEGRGLWLMGHTGTGKTTLGYMIAATATEAQHSVLSFNAVALLNRVRTTIDADSRETSEQVIRTLAEVELLHIEDLRVVRPTEWVLEQLYLIVNTRYEERRSIVFTSDIDSDEDGPLEPIPRELEQHIGTRTFSRLLEMCGDPVVIMGADKRVDADVPGSRSHLSPPAPAGPAADGQSWAPPAPELLTLP
jgi:DNA replication protein DnaC